jgi:hypothetical protein
VKLTDADSDALVAAARGICRWTEIDPKGLSEPLTTKFNKMCSSRFCAAPRFHPRPAQKDTIAESHRSGLRRVKNDAGFQSRSWIRWRHAHRRACVVNVTE